MDPRTRRGYPRAYSQWAVQPASESACCNAMAREKACFAKPCLKTFSFQAAQGPAIRPANRSQHGSTFDCTAALGLVRSQQCHDGGTFRWSAAWMSGWRYAVPNLSRRGPPAGLLLVLALAAWGPMVAGQELRGRAQVLGAQGDGDAWRAPDARVTKTVMICPPVPAPPARDGTRTVGHSPTTGDFWTPEELRRLQPPRGYFGTSPPRN
jgi:hypothetical protein